MDNILQEPVFRYFGEISRVPRCSGNEKAISDYLVSFARSRNLEVYQDRALNVIIRKPGTHGYENSPGVIIQGHMDMVCDKNKDTEHDFENEPIMLRIEGDMIYADKTTLGADNGIAIAYALELLSSDNIPHPPLEVLVTTEEETGMDGAAALEPDRLKGRYLINIDSEEEGKLLVSCAGGIMVEQLLPIIWEDPKDNLMPYDIAIKGLKGGHSGMEIHMGRANSNKLMGRILDSLRNEIEFYIGAINGGFKSNAIPREADALILVDSRDEQRLKEKIREWDSIFKNEYRTSDPEIDVSLEKSQGTVKKVFSRETLKGAIASLMLIPNGINTMSMEIKGLVESSSNLGVVKTTDSGLIFQSATRSSVKSLKYDILGKAKTVAELVGAKIDGYSDYPEWQYDPDSRLRKIFEDVYGRMYGRKPEIVAIHAGLECGLFKLKMPDIDMISLGPSLYDVHTPNEHMSISSVKRVWEYLLEVLKELK